MTNLRTRSGKYATAQQLRASAWARHDHVFAMWYVDASRPVRDPNAFTATGAEMLDRLHTVKWVKTTPEAIGRVRGLMAGQVALWAGIALADQEPGSF